MFKYPIINYETGELGIEYDEAYLKKRPWKAAITAPGVLYQRRVWDRKEKPPELIELVNQGADSFDDALTCWLEFNCIGRWDKVGHKKIEFEEECDAVMYKIIFAEYL